MEGELDMKKIITIFVLTCAITLNLTACNIETPNDEGSTSNKLPINVSNDIAETSTSYVEIQKPPVSSGTSENTSENTSSDNSGGTDPSLEDPLPLVPDNGAMMDASTSLGEFIINGIMFNITEPDLTPNDIGERVGGNFGNWGLGYDDYNSKQGLDDKAGYRFYGAGFSYAGGGDAVYIEALDKNGELITDWRYMSDEGELTYDDYTVKGIRFSVQTTPAFVHFIGGLEVGKQPEYYEELLGKGYEVERIDDEYSYMSYRLSIYKTPTVTMVLEYREKQRMWYNESITLIKN